MIREISLSKEKPKPFSVYQQPVFSVIRDQSFPSAGGSAGQQRPVFSVIRDQSFPSAGGSAGQQRPVFSVIRDQSFPSAGGSAGQQRPGLASLTVGETPGQCQQQLLALRCPSSLGSTAEGVPTSVRHGARGEDRWSCTL